MGVAVATKRRAAALPVPTEHEEQVTLFRWWQHVRAAYGNATMFAIPNGGDRHPAVAAKLRAEGVLAGVPDVFLAAARSGRHGLWIELKRRRGGSVSDAQRAMHAALTAEGYAVVVARGFDEARVAIDDYLRGVPR